MQADSLGMAFQETEEEDVGAKDELGRAAAPGIAESFISHSSVADGRVGAVGRAARTADGEFFEVPRGERHVVLLGFCLAITQGESFLQSVTIGENQPWHTQRRMVVA